MRWIHRKVTLSVTDRLWDLWVRTFAYIERLFDCFLSIFVQVYAAQGSAPKEGDNVTAGCT
jgi:hypothetical protein